MTACEIPVRGMGRAKTEWHRPGTFSTSSTALANDTTTLRGAPPGGKLRSSLQTRRLVEVGVRRGGRDG
jgi:hypothetical protein